MGFKDKDLPPVSREDEALPPAPPSGEQRAPGRSPWMGGDLQGPSSLLLDRSGGGLAPPLDEEAEIPPPIVPPRPTEAAGQIQPEEEELRTILLDEAPAEPAPEAAAVSAPEAAASAAPDAATPGKIADLPNGDEISLLLLDEEPPSDQSAAAPTAPPAPPAVPPGAVDLLDQSAPSALLIGEEAVTPRTIKTRWAAQPPRSEATRAFGESLASGPSSLLIDGGQATAPPFRQETAVPPRRIWKRRRDRVRIVPPKRGAEIKWFSNPDACATYCYKHSRPLLLYFTTGDVQQCHTYEVAIRQTEMQPFLAPYICCMVNMAYAEGRKVAMRLGVPTDGPAIVLLSPSGREYARVLKPAVDWQFVATMLFWALR
jgi:hypothetical protein